MENHSWQLEQNRRKGVFVADASEADIDLNQSSIVLFEPAVLDFREKYFGFPAAHSVLVINVGNEELQLQSMYGNTDHFYSSYFVNKVVQCVAQSFSSVI